ncbi:hypothetical protein NP493_1752g00002 [Ridgeia piscesae]|uniref:Tyrosine-protein kinase ephrin type A/B receptor-like domain-containing protein n=1 Tax=Ridgeia piscesae TaxID=27915 RepID=A0AAD9JVJ8_RIDPI|nr:hypothetical protein NP493_1752g00002 [Ridgeia piscesae]
MTDGDGHAKESDCVADCREGTKFSDASQQSCTDCPRGWYQDELWQDQCKKCPGTKTTPSNHSTSLADCKRTCNISMVNITGLDASFSNHVHSHQIVR